MLNETQSFIAFEEMCFYENSAWLSNLYYPGIYHIDLETHEMSIEALLDDGIGAYSYTAIAYFDGKLILAPNNAENILIYCLKEKRFIKKIDVTEYISVNINQLFKQIIINDDKAYFIPGRSNCILIMNLKDYSIEAIDLYGFGINRHIYDNNRITFRRGRVTRRGSIIIPFFQDGKLLILHEKKEIEIYDISDDPLTDICEFGDCYYLLLRDKSQIIEYNIYDERISRYDIKCPNFIDIKGFSSACLVNEDMVLAPRGGNAIVKWNIISHETEIMNEINHDESFHQIWGVNTLGVHLANGKCFIDVCCKNELYVYDLKTHLFDYWPLRVNDDGLKLICKRRLAESIEHSEFIYEKNKVALSQFIQGVVD